MKVNKKEIIGKALINYTVRNLNSPFKEVDSSQFLEVAFSVLDAIEENGCDQYCS